MTDAGIHTPSGPSAHSRATAGSPAHGRAPKRRATKPQLRAVAWIAGGAAFAAPLGALAAAPTPADRASSSDDTRPVTIVRRITKRIVITHPAAQPAPARFVAAPGSSSTGSTAVDPSPPAAPAVAPPAATTSGS